MYTKLISKNLLNLNETVATSLFENFTYPWEILNNIKNFILEIGPQLPKDIYNNPKENVWIAKTARVADSASISGPAIIQENSEIRHCAFIRGNVIVGNKSVVGNSTELKNSILFNEVQVPHYNYVGDSILGFKSHMGAGSITSNVKSDKSLVCILFDGQKINTNLKKLGAIIGDYCEIGCNAVLNPGTIIGKNTSIYPLSMVRGYIESDSIFKNNGVIIKKY